MRTPVAAAAAFAIGVTAIPQGSYVTETVTTTTTTSKASTTNWATYPLTWLDNYTTWEIKTWSGYTWSAPVTPHTSTCSVSTVTATVTKTYETTVAASCKTSAPSSYETPTSYPTTTTVPSSYETTPSSYETTPSSYKTSPSSYETTPSSYQTTPSSYQTTPSSYQTTPSSYQTTPSSYQTTPSSYKSTTKPSSYESTITPSSYTAPQGYPSASSCMSPAQATVVADNFKQTINDTFNKEFVRRTFAKDFMDYSDSVIELIDSGCDAPIPLGSATFSSRHAFIEGQSSQQPIPFEILNYWTGSCTEVTIRWRASPGPGGPTSPQQQVTGIIAIETKANPDPTSSEPWLIETVYSEFNSGAWLYDLGVFVPSCSSSKAKRDVGMRLF